MTTPLQAAFEAIAQAIPLDSDEKDLLVAAKLRGLMRGYDEKWGEPDFEVLGIEQTVTAELSNIETKAKSRTFTIAGKLDLTGMRDGRRVLIDHKTTSEDIAKPDSPYWRQLVVESQPSHYALLECINGRKIDEITWDVVKKPVISPKNIAKKEREWATRSGHYFGFPVSKESLSEMDRTERETLEMYEYRLAYDCTTQRPEHYFQRRTIPRLDSDIHEHAVELWENAQNIIHTRARMREGKMPPRHSGSCMNYNTPCTFLGICSGHDSQDSNNWVRKIQVHAELPGLEGDGRSVLTNSRIRCFQVCPRKHYYSYELGIERVNEEDRESLYFGTAFHSAIEQYFSVFQSQEQCA